MAKQVSIGLFIVLCILVPRTAHPQALTGTLMGTVYDEQGGVLPAASVRVTSQSLIGGPASAQTRRATHPSVPLLTDLARGAIICAVSGPSALSRGGDVE